MIDGRGHSRVQVRDGLGRTIRMEVYNGVNPNWTLHAQQTYAYDALDNLVWTRNESNHATQVTMSYDWLGRKSSMTDPSMGTWTYAYDLNGNLTRQTDVRGTSLFFQYDALNRVMQRRLDARFSVFNPAVIRATFTYDTGANGIGRRTAIWVDGVLEKQWSYDARGRVTQERVVVPPLNNVPNWVSTSYAYDSADRVTSMTYPDGEVVTTGYNDAMVLVSLAGTAIAHRAAPSVMHHCISPLLVSRSTSRRWTPLSTFHRMERIEQVRSYVF
jgi:YD repeat-containing protein